MSKFCPSCGEELVDNAKFCKNCGKNLENFSNSTQNVNQFSVPTVEKSHKVAIVLGYICAILIPLFGLIFAVYLLTRNDSDKAKSHGKYILIIAVIVWVLSFIFIR